MGIYRVIVRGRFVELDEPTRERLRAELDEHDVLVAGRFTTEGSLTYERPLRNFTMRFEVREPDQDAAFAEAERRTVAHLDAAGIPHVVDRVVGSDMATVWD
ncbi:MAG: hypothetical protein JWN67_4608 [Actinomycetia bacterium]|nr:hypothetical protein [Actinomycetes bacterium]